MGHRISTKFALTHTLEICKKFGIAAIGLLASRLACIFKDDNPAFDRGRFLQACGINGPVQHS